MSEVWQRLSTHKPPRNDNGRAQTVLLWGFGSYSLGQWDESFEQFDQFGRNPIDVTHWQKLPSRPSAQELVEAQQEALASNAVRVHLSGARWVDDEPYANIQPGCDDGD